MTFTESSSFDVNGKLVSSQTWLSTSSNDIVARCGLFTGFAPTNYSTSVLYTGRWQRPVLIL